MSLEFCTHIAESTQRISPYRATPPVARNGRCALHPAYATFIMVAVLWAGGSVYVKAQSPLDSLRFDPSLAGLQVDTLQYVPGDTLQLDRFIIEGSEAVLIEGRALETSEYTMDYWRGVLHLNIDSGGRVVARYRTFPFNFPPVYQRREIRTLASVTDTSSLVRELEAQSRLEQRRPVDPFGSSTIQRSGSITRGIVAGNNRDVAVESGLRMQLAGELVDGVNVQAVLTDENTPIQPEGTTQRLNEFDRVFIEIAARQGTVQLGDFDYRLDNSEFAQFNRKLQGIRLFGVVNDVNLLSGNTKGPGIAIDVAGATARGIFRTQTIEPVDGIQGPYRLEGENGEQFIIVVAGSDIVYVDGIRMTRGETNDYVIDYATGEITFTANRIITSERRITVEFQYTTNQFSRSLTGASVQAHLGQRPGRRPVTSFGVTFLREADGDLFNEDSGLTGADSLQIMMAGDGRAQSSGAEQVIFDPEAPYVHYRQQEVLVEGGQVDTIFVAIDAAPADTIPVFRVRFTRVGTGEGSYVRLGRQINGILYEYRGPGEGDYEPVRILPAPANHNVLDISAAIEPIPGVAVFGEWARSFSDQNRLSSLDSQDDIDYAYKGGVRLQEIPVDFGFAERGYVDVVAQRRQIGAYFDAFNRIRPVEFERKWNLNARTVRTAREEGANDEVVDALTTRVQLNPKLFVAGELGRIDLGMPFEAQRQRISLGAYDRVDYQVEWIQSDDTVENEEGNWVRQLGTIRQPLWQDKVVPGIRFEQERREQLAMGTDSLTRASLAFTEIQPSIAYVGARTEASFLVALRNEQDWAEGSLRDAATATTYQGQFEMRPSASFNTDGSVGYRVREFREYFRINERREDTESLILRWNTRSRVVQRAIDVTTRYEASTERTPTLQEIYIRTGPELGQFVWEDTNDDGIIQIDEFLPERTPNEGNYVQTFVPSDSLSSVINVRALVRLQMDLSRIWNEETQGIGRFLRQITSRTTFEVQEKSRDPELSRVYLLDLSRFRDPVNTLNGRIRLNQHIALFRLVPKVGVDIRFNQLRSLSELAAGEESRFLNVWNVEGRFAPSRTWGFRFGGERESNRLGSESFASRNYRITAWRVEPEVTVNLSSQFSVVAGGIWAQKEDDVGSRSASVWRVPLEVRYRRLRKAQVTARSEIAIVDLSGNAEGLAAFELTDGRGAGTSYLWGVTGDVTINQYLKLTFSYDGRAPSGAPTLHTFRTQLSAVF